jgi:hypothetical protein
MEQAQRITLIKCHRNYKRASTSDQRFGPVSVTVRRTQVENTQNAPHRLGRIFGRAAAIARFVKTGESQLSVPNPLFGRHARRAAELPADRSRGRAVGRQKNNPRPLAQSMLSLRRAYQAFELGALRHRRCDGVASAMRFIQP